MLVGLYWVQYFGTNPMTERQAQIHLLKQSPEIRAAVEKFLKDNKHTLYNFAFLGAGEYRVMFRDKNGKVSAEIFPVPS